MATTSNNEEKVILMNFMRMAILLLVVIMPVHGMKKIIAWSQSKFKTEIIKINEDFLISDNKLKKMDLTKQIPLFQYNDDLFSEWILSARGHVVLFL